MEHTGIDPTDITSIPEGSVISRRYFCFPDMYSINKNGQEYGGYREALHAAILDKTSDIKEHRERHQNKVLRVRQGNARVLDNQDKLELEPEPEPEYVALPEVLWVDTRWIITFDGAPMTDLMVARTRYDSLADAVEHLDRLSVPGEY